MKTSESSSTWKLLFHVVEAFHNMRDRSTPKQRRQRITLSQLKVLGCVLFHPERKVMVKEIASELGITSGGVSQILDRLVRGGMVERKVSENDRRAVEVILSPRGEELQQKRESDFDSLETRLMNGIPASKQRCFRNVLEKMLTNIQSEKEPKGRKKKRAPRRRAALSAPVL